MADVFLSYACADALVARSVAATLETAGLKVLMPSNAQAGEPFADVLTRAADEVSCIVVLWSAAAAKSDWVQNEVRIALKAWSNDRLVLAVLDGTELPAGLRDLPALDLATDRERGTEQIAQRAQSLIAARTLPNVAGHEQPAAAAPIGVSKSRHSNRRFIGIAGALSMLIVIAVGAVWMFGPLPEPAVVTAPEPVPPPAEVVTAPEPISPPAQVGTEPDTHPADQKPERSLFGDLGPWPWVIGGSTVLLAMTMLVVARLRFGGAKTVPARKEEEDVASQEPHEIFVSYSQQDTPSVDRLVEHIEWAGYTVWIDREGGGFAGHRYAAPIVSAIRSSRLVALMCSSHSFASDHVVREVYVAGDYKKPFIAFQLDQTPLPDDLVYFLSGYPRIPANAVDPEHLKSELRRYVAQQEPTS